MLCAHLVSEDVVQEEGVHQVRGAAYGAGAGPKAAAATLEQLRGMDIVRRIVGSMRVEGEAGE